MFKLHSEGKTTLISPRQLAETLVARSIDPTVSSRTQQAVPILAEAISERMESQGLLRDASPRTLLALGIGVGYYLNTFFRRNQVEIQEQVNENNPS